MSIDPRRFAELLASVERIALDAGAAIMSIYETEFAVAEKADQSPVTEADELTERVIIAALEQLTPDTPIVAEEKAARGDFPDIASGEFWLVDPLDGTREFVNRNGEFTVNIALISNTAPILGVVYVPANRRLYAGAVSLGATVIEADEAARSIHTRPAPDDGLMVVASRSHLNDDTQAFIDDLDVTGFKHAGSSLKFCLVAEGEADIYPRLGRTMEWDTAAGHAVLASAGGSVTTLDGAPLGYGKASFENPHFVARGLVG